MLKRLKNTFNYVLFATFLATALTVAVSAQKDESTPTLRDGAAIEQLKRNGQYESLKAAIKVARQNDEPAKNAADQPTDDLLMQSAKFVGGPASNYDVQGSSLSVSGDTVIVGAPYATISTYAQGAAYIFVRSGTVWTQQAKLIAPDAAREVYFGTSVGISGNTAIVGAPYKVANTAYNGAAYIFVRSGTVWTLQQQITGTVNYTLLSGSSVAVSGDTAFVGARNELYGGTFSGAVSVYVRSGTTWTLQQKLGGPNPVTSDFFGASLAISGDTLVVGAPVHNFVCVFVRSGTTWTFQAKLTTSDSDIDDRFGGSVAVSGDTVVVGAPLDDVGSNTDQGSAYVFKRSGTVWTQQAKLVASDGAANTQFGSVGVSGDIVIVGALYSRIGANVNQGAAYIFTRSGTAWNIYKKVTATDGAVNDEFGAQVALSDDMAIITATGVDYLGVNNSGGTYVFRNPVGGLISTWEQEGRKSASDGSFSDSFGWSVSLSGDTAIVGAPAHNINPNASQGAAYVFVRQGNSWVQQQKLTASDGDALDSLGISVAISGNTAAIGATGVNYGPNGNQGAVYLFTRSDGVWTQQQKITSSDGAASDFFGSSVGIYNDTLVVGSSNKRVGTNDAQGAAYVFTRTDGIWSEQQKLTADDGAGGDQFGKSIAVSLDTVIVGAPISRVGTNNSQGAAYVFVRTDGTWAQQQKLTSSDGAAYDQFGLSVAVSSNGAVVGAPEHRVGTNDRQGAAYVFDRSGSVWTQQRILTAPDGSTDDKFGYSVGIAGNKVVVGAYWDNVGAVQKQGSVYLFTRSGANWVQERLNATDGAGFDYFGQSVAISDTRIIVGAPGSDSNAASLQKKGGDTDSLVPDQGGVYFFKNTSFAPTAAGLSISGRVLTGNGVGLQNANVYLTKPNGETITARSTSFGSYRFDSLEAGGTYIVTVVSKRYTFANPTRIINLADNIADEDFIAEP